VIGLGPREVDALTLWELTAAIDGWAAANGAEAKPPAMTDEEAAELGIEGF
jgi:hypothetical protein